VRSREPVTAPEAAARRSPGPVKAHRPARAVSVGNARTSVWAVVRATAAQAWADRVFGLAAEAGFWALLSLTPLLLVLVAAVGYLTPLFGAHLVVELEKDMLRGAGHFMAPAAVQQVLTPVLTDVLQHGRGGIISLSFPLALWTGSTAMNTYVNTITISYGMRHVRSAVRARLVAFGLYLGALVAGVAALPLLVTAPRWIADVAPGPVLSVLRPVVAIAYWPVLVVVCTGLLATLYHVAVPVRGRWRRDLPGAIAAMLMWLASSLLLRAYLAFAIGHSPTYGALSAPVAILLFLYVSALAVLLGGELNAQIASCRPAPPSRDMLSVPARRLDERGPARDGAPHDDLVDLPRPLIVPRNRKNRLFRPGAGLCPGVPFPLHTRVSSHGRRASGPGLRPPAHVYHQLLELRPAAAPLGERAENALQDLELLSERGELRLQGLDALPLRFDVGGDRVQFLSRQGPGHRQPRHHGHGGPGGKRAPETSQALHVRGHPAQLIHELLHRAGNAAGRLLLVSHRSVLLPAGAAARHPPRLAWAFTCPEARRARLRRPTAPCGGWASRPDLR
jgi:membrane protein